MFRPRIMRALVVLAAAASLPGCQLFPYWMQPSQLWKLNRQPAYDESAFSVPDPGEPPNVHEGDAAGLSLHIPRSEDEEVRG